MLSPPPPLVDKTPVASSPASTELLFPAPSLHDAARSRRAHRTFFAILIGICFVASLAGRLAYLWDPYGSDGAMFVYMGKLVSHGGRIGIELIDNKFPTVGLLMSGPWAVLADNWPAYVLLQTGLMLAAIAMLSRAAGKALGPQAALPTALFATVFLNFYYVVDGGFRLESIQIFFAVIAGAAALNALRENEWQDSFLVGLAAAVAAMVKPSGLAVLAAFVLAVTLRRKSVKHPIAAMAGLGIPAGVTFLYLRAEGLLPQIPLISQQIGRYASQSRWDVWDLAKWLIVGLVGGLPLMIRAVQRRKDETPSVSVPDGAMMFVLLWMAIEAAGILAQGRMYPYHFLVLAAPAALLFGMIRRPNRTAPLVAALGPALALSLYGATQMITHADQSPTSRSPASDYLAAHAGPTDTFWKDYMMRALVETDVQPASHQLSTFMWANDDESPQKLGDALLKDLDQKCPRFILLPTDLDGYLQRTCEHLRDLALSPTRRANFLAEWGKLRELVNSRYKPVAHVGRETVYERITSVPH